MGRLNTIRKIPIIGGMISGMLLSVRTHYRNKKSAAVIHQAKVRLSEISLVRIIRFRSAAAQIVTC